MFAKEELSGTVCPKNQKLLGTEDASAVFMGEMAGKGHSLDGGGRMSVSTRNQIEGTITSILKGNVVTEVDAETLAGLVAAVVTTRSVDELCLKVGDKVTLFVEAMNVTLGK